MLKISELLFTEVLKDIPIYDLQDHCFLFKLLKLIFNLNLLLILFIFCGVVIFCSTRKHILLSLLRLEFIVLSVYFVLFLFILIYGLELYFVLIFLVFTVCEGALGLSLLVRLVRRHGNDYLSRISVLSW